MPIRLRLHFLACMETDATTRRTLQNEVRCGSGLSAQTTQPAVRTVPAVCKAMEANSHKRNMLRPTHPGTRSLPRLLNTGLARVRLPRGNKKTVSSNPTWKTVSCSRCGTAWQTAPIRPATFCRSGGRCCALIYEQYTTRSAVAFAGTLSVTASYQTISLLPSTMSAFSTVSSEPRRSTGISAGMLITVSSF